MKRVTKKCMVLRVGTELTCFLFAVGGLNRHRHGAQTKLNLIFVIMHGSPVLAWYLVPPPAPSLVSQSYVPMPSETYWSEGSLLSVSALLTEGGHFS